MIKLMKSSFYNEEVTRKKLADFVLKSELFSMGKQCAKFEKSFARKQRRRFAVFVSSGSAANLALLQSLLNLGRLKKGDRVGVSALTWATNVMPIIQLGMVPVALDCDLATLNVSPRILEKEIEKLSGLFLTNALGFCDDIAAIKKMTKKYGVLFIEDNCESLGSKFGGVLLGNFGLASTFSFFVGHHLSTIEGGMVCTDDERLWHMLIKVRTHGWDRNLPKKRQQQLRKKHKVEHFYAQYTFYDLSYNLRPTEIKGFLGNEQIKYWNLIVKAREGNFKKFQRAVSQNDDFLALDVGRMDLVSNFAMPVVCRSKKLANKYKQKFMEADVEIRPIIAGDITRQPFFRKYVKDERRCDNARLADENGFYFGNNPELTPEEIKLLIKLLRK